MRTHFPRPVFLALLAGLVALLAAGCGGGSSGGGIPSGSSGPLGKTGSGSNNGVSASASLSGTTVTMQAHTIRSDTASVWATVTGAPETVTFSGSGQDWAASTTVDVAASATISIQVYSRDSLGNTWGPALVQLKMGEYGATNTVVGHVVSRDTGTAVAGATVSLGGQVAQTDADGKFVISGLVIGSTLQGTVNKSGYTEQTFTVNVTTDVVDAGTITIASTPDQPPPVPVFN